MISGKSVSIILVNIVCVFLIISVNGTPKSNQVNPSPSLGKTYTAAVVEVNPDTDGHSVDGAAKNARQIVDILGSRKLNGVDIVVLPEAVINRRNTSIPLPSTKMSYCDDKNADPILRNISCAIRKSKRYAVIDLYVRVKCAEDDQKLCVNKDDSTNLYNMAIIFDRQGIAIAKYRKYHLFGEVNVQHPITPDLITFKTDFNVTFGVCICFDLMFNDPMKSLIQKGVRNFVYPTYWFSEIPYLTSAQYQYSWAYGNNVNLLAANANNPATQCSGSGIYNGRSGALKIVVSEIAATKILVAKVPVDLPANNEIMTKSEAKSSEYILPKKIDEYESISQDNLTDFSVEFLNFADKLSQSGKVCNNGICCRYNVEVSDLGAQKGNSSYFYAISVFDGQRHFKTVEKIWTGEEICSVIACTEYKSKDSCGLRIPMSKFQQRYKFKKLHLSTELPISTMTIMPNTLSQELLPFEANEFEYNVSKVKGANRYAVTLDLKASKANILTIAIFARNYDIDDVEDYEYTRSKNKGIISTMRSCCCF